MGYAASVNGIAVGGAQRRDPVRESALAGAGACARGFIRDGGLTVCAPTKENRTENQDSGQLPNLTLIHATLRFEFKMF